MSIAVTVIGYGNVGRVLTNLLLGSNMEMDLNIMDPADWLSGAFLDLKHATGMQPNKRLYFNDADVFERSNFVFFTAGVPSKHGTSRLSTVKDNLELVHDVFAGRTLRSDMRIIAITNPVDIITAGIITTTKLPKNQVIGTGTYLDSMRFSYHLAEQAGVRPMDVNALILGEHGESCAPILSHSTFRNAPLKNALLSKMQIEKALYQTVHAAFEIRKTESGTSMAVSHCALRIMEYWMSDTEVILPLSVVLDASHVTWLELQYPICMSVPVGISSKGLRIQDPLALENGELSALRRSAQVLSEYQEFLKGT